jgi:hypothetical protein
VTNIQQAYYTLQTTLVRFMPPGQRILLLAQLGGEEGAGIAEIITHLAQVIADMPVTYETESQGDAAVIHLHYFLGGVSAWVTEKDKGRPDVGDIAQNQAFGLVTLSGDVDDAELGYISIQELIENGVELDLYWTPRTLAEVTAS